MICLLYASVGFLIAFGLILLVGEVLDAFRGDPRSQGHP